MGIRLIIRFFGGMWKLRERCLNTHSKTLKYLYLLLYRAGQFESSCFISHKAWIKSKPCFPHGLHGIFISSSAVIGHNCVLFHQTTIGSNTLLDSQGLGAPTIGDNCYIGAGAKIIGKVVIGNNVRIGANTVVYKDVPDNSIVVSNSQTIIQRNEPLNNRYYSYRDGWVYCNNGEWLQEGDRKILEILDKKVNHSVLGND
ncbi:MAG: serine acetyltransferase [Desulfocapsa sp.]|nr:serine acetyltransferase [Desulfocapsa sp.]